MRRLVEEHAIRVGIVGARIAIPTCDRGERDVADELEWAARALAPDGVMMSGDEGGKHGMIRGLDRTDGGGDGSENIDQFVCCFEELRAKHFAGEQHQYVKRELTPSSLSRRATRSRITRPTFPGHMAAK